MQLPHASLRYEPQLSRAFFVPHWAPWRAQKTAAVSGKHTGTTTGSGGIGIVGQVGTSGKPGDSVGAGGTQGGGAVGPVGTPGRPGDPVDAGGTKGGGVEASGLIGAVPGCAASGVAEGAESLVGVAGAAASADIMVPEESLEPLGTLFVGHFAVDADLGEVEPGSGSTSSKAWDEHPVPRTTMNNNELNKGLRRACTSDFMRILP